MHPLSADVVKIPMHEVKSDVDYYKILIYFNIWNTKIDSLIIVPFWNDNDPFNGKSQKLLP
jgi:hypothetical protein